MAEQLRANPGEDEGGGDLYNLKSLNLAPGDCPLPSPCLTHSLSPIKALQPCSVMAGGERMSNNPTAMPQKEGGGGKRARDLQCVTQYVGTQLGLRDGEIQLQACGSPVQEGAQTRNGRAKLPRQNGLSGSPKVPAGPPGHHWQCSPPNTNLGLQVAPPKLPPSSPANFPCGAGRSSREGNTCAAKAGTGGAPSPAKAASAKAKCSLLLLLTALSNLRHLSGSFQHGLR